MVCGEVLLSTLFEDRPESTCGLCQRAHPPFEKAVAYGRYEGNLRELIYLLKYRQVRSVAGILGRQLADVLGSLEVKIPAGRIAVIPVPLHPRKRAQRGFNQSEVIARAALKCLDQPERFELLTGVLVRQRETESQIGRTRHQRRENLRGAFIASATQIAGCNVILIDDVLTTGTTASECTRVLRKAGASRIWVTTVARTLRAGALIDQSEFSEDSARLAMAVSA